MSITKSTGDVVINRHSDGKQPRDVPPLDTAVVTRFHREVLPGYSTTPLKELQLGEGTSSHFKGKVYLKMESDRYGLPAFKVLGAAFASYIVLCQHWHLDPATATLAQLQDKARDSTVKDLTLVAATDGNHGRAVAHFSSLVGISARIYIPWTVEEVSERAIDSEGEKVEVVRLKSDYDEAVKEAASFTAQQPESRLLIQDTAWEGYTETPQLIVEGYQTIHREVGEQLEPSGPTHVICPVGVGSLAQSMVHFYNRSSQRGEHKRPYMLSVEPYTAACLFESLTAGECKEVKTDYTVMPGLCCGTPSSVAWPFLLEGIAAGVKIADEEALRDVDWLKKQYSIAAGPCGGAPLAALKKLLSSDYDGEARELGLLDDSSVKVILLMTEGTLEA
ncbi:unnamed protein product [Parajaminaea phylloscopi]